MGAKVRSRFYRREEFLMSSGKAIVLITELIKSPDYQGQEFPNGQKFKWIAYNRVNPDEQVRFDNHRGKAPHYHDNGHEEFFTWKSRKHTQQMFYQKLIEKFGNLVQKL